MVDGERVYVDVTSGKLCRFPGQSGGWDNGAKRLGLFDARMDGLLRWAAAHNCRMYFLTLTVRDPSTMDLLPLNRLMNFLRWRFRRANMPFAYLWVLEPQLKRYGKYGVMAPHWHIAIACPEGALPDVEFRENCRRHWRIRADGRVVKQSELLKHWGYGVTYCAYAKGDAKHYMAKYMMKALLFAGLWGHRFGSSVLGWWKVSKWAYECVRQFWDAGCDILRVWFTRGDVARLLHFTVTDGVTMESYNVVSPWRRMVIDSVDA